MSDFITPALLINTSKWSNLSLTHLNTDNTSASFVTSHFFGMIFPLEFDAWTWFAKSCKENANKWVFKN